MPSSTSSPASTKSHSSSMTSRMSNPSSTSPPPPQLPPSSQLPSNDLLRKAGELSLYNQNGQETPLKLLYPQPGQRVLLLFIRHFFCGNCQEYLRRLAGALPPSSLPLDLQIAIIGCGSWTLIPSYIEVLDLESPFPYPIYAEPTKALHELLHLQYSLSLGNRAPKYMRRSLLRVNVDSTVQGLKRLWGGHGDALAAGDMRLNGGEFLLKNVKSKTSSPRDAEKGVERRSGAGRDPSGETSAIWCHRMANSRNHTEVDELSNVLLRMVGQDHEAEFEREQRQQQHPDSEEEKSTVRESRRLSTTADKLRRSFSNRRQSWLGRSGSVRTEHDSSREGSRRRRGRSADASRTGKNSGSTIADMTTTTATTTLTTMRVVREEVRSRDGGEKPAFAAVNGSHATAATVMNGRVGVST